MTTRDDVLDAISRVEQAGQAGAVTRAAQLELLMLPSPDYELILGRLRAAFPQLFPTPRQPSSTPAPPPPAAPPEQHGAAIQAMKHAETALSQQHSAIAEFDRQVIEALLHAQTTTAGGRQLLDDLETQIECAARSWDLSSAAGAREFQRFLIAKLGQVITVVDDSSDDDAAKQALAAAWAALYAAQADRGESTIAKPGESGADGTQYPEQYPLVGNDIDPEMLPLADPDPIEDVPRPAAPATPALPTLPPGTGAMPIGGAPGGMPLTGLPPGWQRDSAPPDGSWFEPADQLTPDDALADQPAAEDTDSDPAEEPETDDGPTTVTLPNGETVTAATPQLAAVIQAAAGGTPVAEAFQRQGITIPPPGTAVVGPVDQSQVSAGDIGMFTDRHALAMGNGKALLDGQIQHIANVTGPSFLGWQHPPMLGETAGPSRTPTPTRPSAAVRV